MLVIIIDKYSNISEFRKPCGGNKKERKERKKLTEF